MSRILIGSTYFFSRYDDFASKDIDEIEIVETNEFKRVRQLTGRGRCLFSLRKQPTKDDYIAHALQSGVGMVVGKFLVPEFCAEIGFNFTDLPRLNPLIELLDAKHKYEEIIYNAYIENGSFVLTDEQRARAFKSYKESRGA